MINETQEVQQNSEDIYSLFEAVYQKDVSEVKRILFAILEDVLKHHPYKPTEDNKQAEKDWRLLELLNIFFDINYEDWMRSRATLSGG